MPLSVRSNTPSLNAQTHVGRTTRELSETFSRLSSGLRINKASDDPAGLAVADSLRSDARVASVAIRNANDGISLTSIADSALGEVSNILTRMAELAEQSANGAYTNIQRSALSSEFVALGSEIDRIAKSTEFNNMTLLSNSSSVQLQVGLRGNSNSYFSLQGVLGTLESLGLSGAGSSTLTYSIITTTTIGSQDASQNALTAVQAALNSVSARRGIVGAAESRLNIAIDYLSLARENLVAAESRIRDADIAQEVANMVRLQVLQQSGTAVLAQANLQPKLVLSLLQ